MVSILSLISKSSGPVSKLLVTVPSALFITGVIVLEKRKERLGIRPWYMVVVHLTGERKIKTVLFLINRRMPSPMLNKHFTFLNIFS